MARKLTIELAGLPGSGKTTIANLLIGALKEKKLACLETSEITKLKDKLCVDIRKNKPGIFGKILDIISYFCFSPVLASKLYAFALLIRPFDRKRLLILRSSLVNYRFLKQVQNIPGRSVLIFEEFFLNNIFCLAFFGRVKKNCFLLKSILKIFYSDNEQIVFYLNVAPQICVERFLARDAPSSRFNLHSKSDVVETFLLNSNVYNEIIGTFVELYPSRLFVIDANSSAREVVAEVMKVLEGFI